MSIEGTVDDIVDPAARALIDTLDQLPRRRTDGAGTRTRGISPT